MADEKMIRSEDFQCVQCGICCRTQKVVLLTLADVFRMAEKLHMRPAAFYRRYCMKSDRFGEGLLRIYLKADGGCPFWKEGQCSVHDFKPMVCARSPFYYFESSLAVLKVLGIIVPGCSIDRLAYDTLARGDRERLIDMEIEVSLTDDYLRVSGKFDERTARVSYESMKEALADDESRRMACQKLLDESRQREDYYRNDPYYKGAASMYLSGFYREFKGEAARMTSLHPGLLTFEPSAVGTVGGDVVVAMQDKEFKELKSRIEGEDGEVIFHPSLHDGFEYSTVTIATNGNPVSFFYYYLDAGKKPALKRLTGKVAITFMNSRKEAFVFSGADRAGWLS
jgi:Fe-S-cluster containining protein